MSNVVTYKEFEEARRNARWLLSQMEESNGFDRAVALDIYPEENGQIKTTVRVHETGLDSVNLMKLGIVMTYANELMETFPYNGYTIKYEE